MSFNQLQLSDCFKKTEINYDFIDDVLFGHEQLYTDYNGLEITPAEIENIHGKMTTNKFLLELCEAGKLLMQLGQFPKIKWKKLLFSVHDAR